MLLGALTESKDLHSEVPKKCVCVCVNVIISAWSSVIFFFKTF